MSKKKIIVIISIIIIVLAIAGIYGTFAMTSNISETSDNVYAVTLNASTQQIVVPANSSKIIVYKLTNTNKGMVNYHVAYSGTNIVAKMYNNSTDSEKGLINYQENKFIKLRIENTGSTESTASISSVIGYEHGGKITSDMAPTGYTLVTEYYVPEDLAVSITNSTATITGPTTVSSITSAFSYTITASATVNDYEGRATLKITDTLPYQIDTSKSTLASGCTYYSDNKTILCTKSYDITEDSYTINETFTLSLVYLNLNKETVTNSIKSQVILDEITDNKEAEVSSTVSKGTVTAKYLLKGSESTVLATAVTKTGLVGASYTTSSKTITGYTLSATPSNATGTYTSSAITVKYLYTKNISNTISGLFSKTGTVTSNSITHDIDATHSMIKDPSGNIRYYGNSPSNYIYFNCETYPSTNCETWRIIGVFDGKLKLLRSDWIGKFSWDSTRSTTNSGKGINEWSQADVMKLMNPGYENNTDLNYDDETVLMNNSLYWTGPSGSVGNCYAGQMNYEYASCNMTSRGLKNTTTKNLIANTTWYLRGYSTTKIYPNEAMNLEKSTGTVIASPSDGITRTTTWTGRVALPYASDYGYAADLTKCTQQLYSYTNTNCKNYNWIKDVMTYHMWLLTPESESRYGVLFVNSNGQVYTSSGTYGAATGYAVYPSLYLVSTAALSGGSGTSDEPYKLTGTK